MGWLTHKALQLDAEVTTAARTADLEEDISLALWRMDVALAPLVAQEAARPYVVYRPFLIDPETATANGMSAPQVSPLLVQPSEFVRLHFQLEEDGSLSSPQCPEGAMQELVIDNNDAPRDNILLSCDAKSLLSEKVQFDALASCLPSQMLPPLEVTDLAWSNRLNAGNYYEADNTLNLDQQVLVQGGAQQDELYQPYAQPQAEGPEQQENNPAPNIDDQVAQLDRQIFNPQMAGPPNQSPNPSRGQAQNPWTDQYGGNFGYGRAPREQTQRGQVEFQRRNKTLQSLANTEVVRQRKQIPLISLPTSKISEGVSAPLWLNDELLLARRVSVDDREVIQGVWFNWEKLKPFLIAEALGAEETLTAALPEFDLRPVRENDEVPPARRLATLPVEIVVTPPKFATAPLSPIRLSLWIAWGCMIFATCAMALLLQGVVTLSERRGAFVSAVTHELRTPLTTFRMYAEMLSSGMVKEPERQQQYTETLRVEADRLSHLVENVLAYARLERGRKGGRREDITLDALLERTTSRLCDRAAQAEMELDLDISDDMRQKVLHTDPQAVEQILFNLVDNACKYAREGNDYTIRIDASMRPNAIAIHVRDHGPGISAKFARQLFQPFSKSVEDAAVTAPGVGLGLALCRRLAHEIGGSLQLDPSDVGAAFCLTLPLAK